MGNLKSIQITIPNPCLESWDEMNTVVGGRFCGHCNKKVTDFTNFSDHQLFIHIKNHGLGCGRYNASQQNRPISIPYQPHSQLYRIAMAIGLTLIVSQSSTIYAQNKGPLISKNSLPKNYSSNGTTNAVNSHVKGKISISPSSPAINATVILYNNGQLAGTTITDQNGNYYFQSLDSGTYIISAGIPGFDSAKSTFYLKQDDKLVIDLSFSIANNTYLPTGTVMGAISVPLPLEISNINTKPAKKHKKHKTK